MLGPLRTLPSLALTAAATTLRLLATINETIAQRINPDTTPAAAVPEDVAPSAPAQPAVPVEQQPTAQKLAAAVSAPAPQPDFEAPDIFDVASLAAQPAPRVIAAIDTLSTAELGDLYIYEAGHRRRRTVLSALESASTPAVREDEDGLPPLDVRVPDELVYSTTTPGS